MTNKEAIHQIALKEDRLISEGKLDRETEWQLGDLEAILKQLPADAEYSVEAVSKKDRELG